MPANVCVCVHACMYTCIYADIQISNIFSIYTFKELVLFYNWSKEFLLFVLSSLFALVNLDLEKLSSVFKILLNVEKIHGFITHQKNTRSIVPLTVTVAKM